MDCDKIESNYNSSQLGGQVLSGGSQFPLNSIGFGITEFFGYFYEDASSIEHMSEDCTAGWVENFSSDLAKINQESFLPELIALDCIRSTIYRCNKQSESKRCLLEWIVDIGSLPFPPLKIRYFRKHLQSAAAAVSSAKNTWNGEMTF